MEVIDKDEEWANYEMFFCRLQKDMFGLEKDSYILLNFSDYEENIDTGCGRVDYDSFEILYLEDKKNKGLTEKIFKQEMVKYPVHYKADIPFITLVKYINIFIFLVSENKVYIHNLINNKSLKIKISYKFYTC